MAVLFLDLCCCMPLPFPDVILALLYTYDFILCHLIYIYPYMNTCALEISLHCASRVKEGSPFAIVLFEKYTTWIFQSCLIMIK